MPANTVLFFAASSFVHWLNVQWSAFIIRCIGTWRRAIKQRLKWWLITDFVTCLPFKTQSRIIDHSQITNHNNYMTFNSSPSRVIIEENLNSTMKCRPFNALKCQASECRSLNKTRGKKNRYRWGNIPLNWNAFHY